MNTQCALVVPAYNEAHRFDMDYFKEIKRLQSGIFLIFVDDGSSDNTLQLLEKAILEIPDSHLLSLSQNKGKSNAVREGFIFCKETHLELDWMGVLDSDGSFCVKDVVNLIENLPTFPESYSAIFTSRVNYSTEKYFQGLTRKIARALISGILTIGWGKAPIGMQSGFKVFRNTRSFSEAIAQEFRTRWFMEWELIIRLYQVGAPQEIFRFNLTEVLHKDNGHINASAIIRIILEVLEIKRQQLTSKIKRF